MWYLNSSNNYILYASITFSILSLNQEHLIKLKATMYLELPCINNKIYTTVIMKWTREEIYWYSCTSQQCFKLIGATQILVWTWSHWLWHYFDNILSTKWILVTIVMSCCCSNTIHQLTWISSFPPQVDPRNSDKNIIRIPILPWTFTVRISFQRSLFVTFSMSERILLSESQMATDPIRILSVIWGTIWDTLFLHVY